MFIFEFCWNNQGFNKFSQFFVVPFFLKLVAGVFLFKFLHIVSTVLVVAISLYCYDPHMNPFVRFITTDTLILLRV